MSKTFKFCKKIFNFLSKTCKFVRKLAIEKYSHNCNFFYKISSFLIKLQIFFHNFKFSYKVANFLQIISSLFNSKFFLRNLLVLLKRFHIFLHNFNFSYKDANFLTNYNFLFNCWINISKLGKFKTIPIEYVCANIGVKCADFRVNVLILGLMC